MVVFFFFFLVEYMALVWKVLLEILQRPTVGDVVVELMLFLGPVWIAVLVGLVVGWAWKPRWANLGREKSDLKVSRSSEMVEREVVASGSESEGLVLPSLGFNFMPRLDSIKAQLPQNFIAWVSEDRVKKEEFEIETAPANSDCRYASFILGFLCLAIKSRFLCECEILLGGIEILVFGVT